VSRSETHWSHIEAAARGDEKAFRELWLRYEPVVRSYLRRRGVREPDDLIQDVFMALLTSVLGKASPERGRFRSLLLTVTRNILARSLRQANADKRGGGKVEALGARDLPAPEQDQDAFDRDWAARLLQLGLQRLAESHPQYFHALQLALEGRSRHESAAALGCSETDVRNRIHRGKKKLVDYVKEEILNYSTTTEYPDELDVFSGLLST
jgi:RNA polymerase sigma factor (sigma-70 family)